MQDRRLLIELRRAGEKLVLRPLRELRVLTQMARDEVCKLHARQLRPHEMPIVFELCRVRSQRRRESRRRGRAAREQLCLHRAALSKSN